MARALRGSRRRGEPRPTGAPLAQTPKRGGTLNLGFDYGGRLMAAWLDR